MVLHGRIEHGTVILSQDVSLPDGTEVTVVIQPLGETASQAASEHKERVRLPLIPSKLPGSRRLTADRVAEILEEDELPS